MCSGCGVVSVHKWSVLIRQSSDISIDRAGNETICVHEVLVVDCITYLYPETNYSCT